MRIAENTTEHGYYWRYDPPDLARGNIRHSPPRCGHHRRRRSLQDGNTHVVASTQMSRAIYVVSSDRPTLSALAMNVLYEMTPTGECIRCDKIVWH